MPLRHEGTDVTVPLDALGIVPAVYRTALRAACARWPATLALFILLLACRMSGVPLTRPGGGAAMQPLGLFAVIGLPVLIAPYRAALYAIAAPERGAGDGRARAMRIAVFAGWTLLVALPEVILIWLRAGRTDPPSILLLQLGLVVPWVWIQVRLCLIGPALALSGLPVDLPALVATTRGQVWRILLAGLLTALPALPVALFVLVAAWGFGLLSGGIPSGVGALLASLSEMVVVVVTASFEVEIYRRVMSSEPGAPKALCANSPEGSVHPIFSG